MNRMFWKRAGYFGAAFGILVCSVAAAPLSSFASEQAGEEIQDITNKYHFIAPEDTLALLDEEGKLHGYVDVFQGEEESDAVLSYTITLGRREKDRVEFKTSKIHQKYFRFSGTVQRGAGHDEGDPDYLELAGDLEIVTVHAGSEKEIVERRHLILKSFGKSEREEE